MAEILIIDDDELICDILARMMENIGHTTARAFSGKQGMKIIQEGRFDIVFLDVNLPDANGLDLIKPIKKSSGFPEVIIITGENFPDGAAMAIDSGAWNYLEKPFLRQELELQVKQALQFRKEKGQVSMPGLLKRKKIIGSSEQIKACLDQVSVAAYSDDNVLIKGEPGSGKELFAKAIHLNSDRSEYNFIILDCANLRQGVVETILFGNSPGSGKGVPTGEKTGRIAQSDNGTLFLKEVSALPCQVQELLLRMIDDGAFSLPGSVVEKSINLRTIAATSKNLEPLVQKKKFSKDLLEKLNGLTIELPAVRQIKQDLVKIALFYIEEICQKMGLDTKGVSPEFIKIIRQYDWPGNIDEMISVLETAVAAAKNEPTLYSVHLPSRVKTKVIQKMLRHNSTPQSPAAAWADTKAFPPLRTLLEQTQKRYLQDLLKQTGGNIKQACRIAEISPSAMYAKLKHYHLN